MDRYEKIDCMVERYVEHFFEREEREVKIECAECEEQFLWHEGFINGNTGFCSARCLREQH
jgi:hypothetical protein